MEGWHDYFFMIGSAAAALIGLMFVVATLTAGRDRDEVEPGKKLYTTPIVWHLGVVVVLSGAAVAPPIAPVLLGAALILASVLGFAYGVWITLGILKTRMTSSFSRYDAFWYGVSPSLLYVVIAISGGAMLFDLRWAIGVLAAAVMALLLVSIHNEWDLVTFLAPEAPNAGGRRQKQ